MMHYDALETPALNQQGNAGESGEDFSRPLLGPNLTRSVRFGTRGRFVTSVLSSGEGVFNKKMSVDSPLPPIFVSGISLKLSLPIFRAVNV